MIDTHSHIYSHQFDEDRDEAIARAVDAGVSRCIMPAIDSTTHAAMFAVAEQHSNHYATIGVHPTSIDEGYLKELDIALELLEQHRDSIYAIGEIGLDKYWDVTHIEHQKKALYKQLEWAHNLSLPAIIHTRDAWGEMIDVLSDFAGSPLRVVLHGYSGTHKEAATILKMGNHLLGIGGPLTYKRSTLPDTIKEVGIEYLVTETDAPYLPPTPYRGKRNESSYIPLIINKLSEILSLSPQQCADITVLNAENIFKLK